MRQTRVEGWVEWRVGVWRGEIAQSFRGMVCGNSVDGGFAAMGCHPG